MAKNQKDNSKIGAAGEFRVLSELLIRGHEAVLTFGNTKATDLIVFSGEKYIRVEVKICKNGKKFVTNFFPKYSDGKDVVRPDMWVLFFP